MHEYKNIDTLLGEKDEASRIAIAQKVSAAFDQIGENQSELVGAEILVHALATDAVERVRAALAEQVRNCRFLPKETAFVIAQDIDDIACPFLSVTEIFSDEEWHDLCSKLSPNALRSVASRQNMTESLALSVTSFGDTEAAATLVENDAAPMTGEVCHSLIARFGHETAIMNSLATRGDLITEIAIKLTLKVSEKALANLWNAYDLKDQISLIHGQAEMEALLRVIREKPTRDHPSLAKTLQKEGRLTDIFLIAVLKENRTHFFEVAVATRARKDPEFVRSVLKHGGKKSILGLFDSAKICKPLQEQMIEDLQSRS